MRLVRLTEWVVALGLSVATLFTSLPAFAEDAHAVTVTIKDHKFDPAEIHVPANRPVVITVKNLDASAEEFESSVLKIEKVVAAGAHGIVRVRPLAPGRYAFVGEFHEDTAKGVIIAE